jgi:sortase A
MRKCFRKTLIAALFLVAALDVAQNPNTVEAKGRVGEVVATLEIPGIKLRTPVRVGFSDATLARDPGWWNKQGPMGGSNGTSITGHRTTHGAEFRKLNTIKRGSSVVLRRGGTVFVFRVTGKSVVKLDQVRVLNAREPYELTLITCHGAASKKTRLVVRAKLVKVTERAEVTPIK